MGGECLGKGSHVWLHIELQMPPSHSLPETTRHLTVGTRQPTSGNPSTDWWEPIGHLVGTHAWECQGVGLINAEHSAMLGGQLAHSLEEAWFVRLVGSLVHRDTCTSCVRIGVRILKLSILVRYESEKMHHSHKITCVGCVSVQSTRTQALDSETSKWVLCGPLDHYYDHRLVH